VKVALQRGDQSLTLTLTPELQTDKNIFGEVVGQAYVIGIERAIETIPVGPLDAVVGGAQETVSGVEILVTGVVKILQGRISSGEIGGPLLIGQAAAQQAKEGLDALVYFMAFISINLGVLNLLPIPVLDGGHLLFFAVEGIMRRPLDMRHREIMQQVGLVILLGLMTFAFYNDILRFIRGGWG
jgi:regulator of sigma E protease